MRRVFLTLTLIIFFLFIGSSSVFADNPLCDYTKVDVNGQMTGQKCLPAEGASAPGGVTRPCGPNENPCDPGRVFCEKETWFTQNFQIGCWPEGAITSNDIICSGNAAWSGVKKCCAEAIMDPDYPNPLPMGNCTHEAPSCARKGFVVKTLADGTITCVAVTYGVWGQYLSPCANNTTGVSTAIGCIPTSDFRETIIFVLKWAYGVTAGIVVVMIILTGYSLLTSAGNPDKLNGAKENIVSIFSGVIMVVFSLIILRIVGVDILGLPTFVMP